MSVETVDESARWYVLHAHVHQEHRAESNLRARSVETFNPKIKERRINEFTGAATYISKSLFPRYLFARFPAGAFLHKVWFTRGVHSVVSFGDRPTPVEDEIVNLIQARVGIDGFVTLNEEFKPGDKVLIKEGPLSNLSGVFEHELKDSERVMILLTTINYQGRVLIERERLRRAS
jgi:transcriptional antiterminator RfaH